MEGQRVEAEEVTWGKRLSEADLKEMVSRGHVRGKGWSRGKEFVPRQICGHCHQSFYAPPIQMRRGGGKYCSVNCYGAARTTLLDQHPNCICRNCGTKFRLAPSQLKRKQGQYCSKECQRQYQQTHARPPYIKKGRRPAEPLPRLVCRACGREYEKKRGSKGIVCSLACWGLLFTKRRGELTYSRGRGGRRIDLDNQYFRSRWEANYARYLNWLRDHGKIVEWAYEPETFEFEGIKRGSRFYTPDFRVRALNGQVEYHEIKGWMDPKSKTKLDRMRRYYPTKLVRVIERPQMLAIGKQISVLIPSWEREAKRGAFG